MTLLTVCQDASVKLNQSRPTSVLTSTDAFALQLQLAAKEATEAILAAYEWQILKTLATLTGDGTTTAFDFPSDYDRMLKKGATHSLSWQTANFREVKDLDEWLYITDTAVSGSPGEKIIYGGQMHIFPAMAVGETARFYYVSNKLIVANDATKKATFTLDSDTLRLPEKLLRLGIVWRWRADRRMEYAEDMTSFELAAAEVYGADKGSSILTVGRTRVPSGVQMAYPGTITP